MITPEQLKQFQEKYDMCCVDVWEALIAFRKNLHDQIIKHGLPPEAKDASTLGEAAVLWMIKRYYDDHMEMAKAQSFIDEIFPNKEK